jgi:membrane associated rhomboid family serine protease
VTQFVILVLVLLSAALYLMSRDERKTLFRAVIEIMRQLKETVTFEDLERDAFVNALRARARWAIVTPAFVAVNLAVFIFVLLGRNAAPQTTGGEWWRPLTAMFVHSRILDLVVNVACLIQVGIVLERLVGRFAFTAVYVGAGVAAAVISVSLAPEAPGLGASGAVLGIYGLLLVTSIWNVISASPLTIPWNIAKRLGVVFAVFVLYNFAAGGLQPAAQLTALVTGVVAGIVVARDIGAGRPPVRRLSAAVAAMLAITAVYAVAVHHPVHDNAVVGTEIERVIAVEKHTSGLYDHAVERFRKGRITAAALAGLIEQTIVPELHAAAVRLTALQDLPPEHQPLVASAEEFLRLRDESWQLRAAALHKADMQGLKQADKKEQVSLQAFQKVRPPSLPVSPHP